MDTMGFMLQIHRKYENSDILLLNTKNGLYGNSDLQLLNSNIC